MHQHIRLVAAAITPVTGHLLLVFVSRAQARLGEDAGQDHLPPVALLLAVALERLGQGRRLLGDLAVELGQPLEFEFQAVTLASLFGMGLAQLATETFQLV